MESETSSDAGPHLQLVGPEWGPVAASAEAGEAEKSEPLLWRGQPSLVLAVGPCVRAVLLLAAAVAWAHGWKPWGWGAPARPAWLSPWFVDVRLWSLLATGWCAYTVLDLKSTRYAMTSTHVRWTRGVLSSRTVEYAVRYLRKVTVIEPWLLRPSGRANVVLSLHSDRQGCGYCGAPKIATWTLRGVADPAGLRRALHRVAGQ